MRRPTCSNADSSARPTVEVRSDGELIRRISEGAAEMLLARGWGEWIGTGRRRYVALTPSAPLSALPGWMGKDGTCAMRADHTCSTYGNQQLMGDPKAHTEFLPVPR